MILDNRTYGIQAFDTPEEAFGLMAFHWTDRSCERMFILNDRQFIRMIGERIITILVDAMLGRVSKDMCKESLGLENAINDYLLDWNFFLYSSVNNRYYTSFRTQQGKGNQTGRKFRYSETTLFTRQSEGQKSKNGDVMDFLWDTYI